MLQNRIRFIGFAIVVYCAAAGRASAQDWTWTTDASAFFGYNYQQRKFADFSAWESQNWFMLDGTRELDSGRLSLVAMLSLEPLTVNAAGSPQLFQTGESYQRQPLSNNQHPHDLFMALGATYRVRGSRICSVRIWSVRRRSGRRRSCIANRRATTRKCRSRIITSIPRTLLMAC